jgi:hypothetical protein
MTMNHETAMINITALVIMIVLGYILTILSGGFATVGLFWFGLFFISYAVGAYIGNIIISIFVLTQEI